MKDEIKEILELIGNSYYYGNISEEQKEKYCNYVTNLQTIEQQYSAILSENAELENKITDLQEQLHQASLDIQELTERDLYCPTNCDKLTNLQNTIKDNEDTIIDKKECIFALETSLNNLQKELEESEEAVKYWQNQCDIRQRVIDKTIHRIQLLQMDGEVTIKDITELANILKGSDKE